MTAAKLKLHLHARVTRRLLRALVLAEAPLTIGELIAACYDRPAPNARHSLGVLIRRLNDDGIAILNPARGQWHLADVSRETVVSILQAEDGIRELAAQLVQPARVDSLRAKIARVAA